MADAPRPSRVLSNIARLATGTAVAQALPLLVTPVIARLYSPAQFGAFGVFSATLLGLSLFVSGRYEIAVPTPASDDDAFHLFAISVAFTAVSLVVLLAAGGLLVAVRGSFAALSWLDTPTLAMLAVGVAGAALSQSCGYWLTRNGRFQVLARSRVTQGVVAAGLSVAFAWTPLAPWGLALSQTVGMMTAAAVSGAALLGHDRHRLRGLDATRMRALAREYREFPLVNAPHAIVDTVKDSGTLILFTGLFGAAAAGFLTQALRVLRAPVTLVGQAVAQVFFPEASARVASGQPVDGMTRKTLKGVLALSIPVYALVLAAGPWLFAFVLGGTWEPAGAYARLLSPWLALALALSSLSLLPVIMRKQPQALALNLTDAALRASGILVGAKVGGAQGAVVGISITGLLIGAVQLTWYLRLSKMRGVAA